MLRLLVFVLFLLGAAGCAGDASPATATVFFSAPTLQPSPTIPIRNSEELYGSDPFGPGDLTAAALPGNAALPPLVVGTPEAGAGASIQLILPDGRSLIGSLVEHGGALRAPGVLLLAGPARDWADLPVRLRQAGMTTLALEVVPPLTAEDVRILLESLSEVNSVNPGELGVVASLDLADSALAGCAVVEMCDVLVMLSPQGGQAATLADYNPRPLLVVVGRDDATAYPAALALLSGAASGRLVEATTGRGTGLLADAGQVLNIVEWLVTNLQPS